MPHCLSELLSAKGVVQEKQHELCEESTPSYFQVVTKESSNQLKENLECARCGENHPATLQFHHRDPQKKDFNLSEAVNDGYSIERIKREVAKCTVLCANCHAKEHYEWARRNKKPVEEGLAAQFQRVEQDLSVSQEEEFAHAVENQYVPLEVDINVYDDSADGL